MKMEMRNEKAILEASLEMAQRKLGQHYLVFFGFFLALPSLFTSLITSSFLSLKKLA